MTQETAIILASIITAAIGVPGAIGGIVSAVATLTGLLP